MVNDLGSLEPIFIFSKRCVLYPKGYIAIAIDRRSSVVTVTLKITKITKC